MIKVIPPNAWNWDQPQVELVKVAGAGLRGTDFAAFVKRASHPLADWVRNNPPRPGEAYVHAIALSAYEAAGCFLAGTPVQTPTGARPIESFKIGDLVLTHKNRYRRVTHVYKADYTGPLITVKASNLPGKVSATPEHPFLVVRHNDRYIHAWVASIIAKSGREPIDVYEDEARAAVFVRADELRTDDHLVVPIRPQNQGCEQLPDDLAYTMGVYLAEGCLVRERRPTRKAYGKACQVLFSLSAVDDQGILGRMRADSKQSMHQMRSLTSDKGMRCVLYGASTAQPFEEHFGWNDATKKFVPSVVFAQSRDWKLRFLAGYFDGDGCVQKTGKPRYIGTVTASTASLGLALDLQKLMACVGIPSAISACKNRVANGCFGSHDRDIYPIAVGSGYAPSLIAECERLKMPAVSARRLQSSARIGHDYMLVPVRDITTQYVTETIKYNLEVEEDNSFVVLSAVHNCNRNGDIYKRAMLQRDHPTFEKFARWYRLHRNTDPAKSYGLIKKSWYSDVLDRVECIAALNTTKEAADRNGGLVADREMDTLDSGRDLAVSQSVKVSHDVCFRAGTLVETATGLRAIETLAIGDEVKTAKGRMRPITTRFQRAFTGTMVCVEVTGQPHAIDMTDTHPLLVIRQEKLRACYGSTSGGVKRRHTFRNGGEGCVLCATPVIAPIWTSAKDVRVGDYLVYPIERPGDIHESVGYAYALGAYLGNGYPIYKRRGRKRSGEHYLLGVTFSLGTHHPDVIDRLVAHLGALTTAKVNVSADGTRAAVTVTVFDRELASRLLTDVGRYSDRKFITPRVFAFDDCARRAFLAGYLDTDGCVDHATHGLGRFTTINRNLANQIQRLVWGLGGNASVVAQITNSFGGRCHCYHITFPGAKAAIGAYSVKAAAAADRRHAVARSFVAGDYMCVSVTSVHQRYDECDVYNIAVAEDETYVAGGVVVHNCNACGNKARSRAEYCGPELCKYGGCRTNLGRVFDDGFHLAVDNPNGRFFDLSNVSEDLGSRGADRTAFATGKVAAADRVRGGAEIAEMFGLVAPEYLLDPRTRSAVACLHKLAAHRHPHPAAPSWAMSLAVREKLAGAVVYPEFPTDTFGRHRLLAELAEDGVILPPDAWLAGVTGVDAEKCAAVFAGGFDVDHHLMRRADLHDLLSDSALSLTKGANDTRLSLPRRWSWLAPTATAHAAESRLGVLAGPPTKAAFSACPPAIRDEAKARYLAYQANCLVIHENSVDLPLLLSECIRHTQHYAA